MLAYWLKVTQVDKLARNTYDVSNVGVYTFIVSSHCLMSK